MSEVRIDNVTKGEHQQLIAVEFAGSLSSVFGHQRMKESGRLEIQHMMIVPAYLIEMTNLICREKTGDIWSER